MANTFGTHFKITTFGESHGTALGVVIDGMPPGYAITQQDIQKELNRRRPGQSKVTTPRAEKDEVKILSGIFENKTTGAPICLVVYNADADSSKYETIKDLYRPGHADYTYAKKYGIRDYRGGGRSSGRETLCRVAAGAVAKKILDKHKITVKAYTKQIGSHIAKKLDFSQIEKNSVRCADPTVAKQMEKEILELKEQGDSIGGIIETVISGCPIGLGEPLYDKLDASLAFGIMSLGAVKGIEFGSGFLAAEMKGSEHNDSFVSKNKKITTETNYAGGILGGISNGEDIIFRSVIKAPASITKNQKTVNSKGSAKDISVQGRHDPCLCPRAVPVIEHMTNIVIADMILAQKLIT